MKKTTLAGIVAFGLFATILAGGCTDYKAQTVKLQNQNDNLKVQNDDLRKKIDSQEDFIEELNLHIQTSEKVIAEKNEKIARLQGKLGQATDIQITATGWERGTFGDKISVGSDVLFSSGKAKLTRTGKNTLSRVVRDIKNTYPNLPVRVYGYTDSDPIKKSKRRWKDNLDLSANRAMAVTRYLIAHGIAKSNIETIAMGDSRFVASNKTRAGKAKNRRVDIMVVR